MGAGRVSHLGSVTEGPSPIKTRFITESLNRLFLLRGIELIPNGTTIITMKRTTAKKYTVTEGSTSTSKGLILDTRVGKLFSHLVLKHSPLLLGSYMHSHFQHTLPEVSSSPCHSLRRLVFSMLQGQGSHASWRRDSGLYMGERSRQTEAQGRQGCSARWFEAVRMKTEPVLANGAGTVVQQVKPWPALSAFHTSASASWCSRCSNYDLAPCYWPGKSSGGCPSAWNARAPTTHRRDLDQAPA